VRDGTPVLDLGRGEPARADAAPATDWRSQRSAAERQLLAQAIRECAGDKAAAAQKLGMSRSTFYRRARDLGL
jgi:DNA-binding NtrC family response regulator